AGADYLGVGPVFETTSKVGALAASGLDLVRAVRAEVTLPLVAIGGITPATAPDVRAAGADAVAMIAALVRAPDVAAAVRDALARLAPRADPRRRRSATSRAHERHRLRGGGPALAIPARVRVPTRRLPRDRRRGPSRGSRNACTRGGT